jgi:hypothetical protein
MSGGKSQVELYQEALRTMKERAKNLREMTEKITDIADKIKDDKWQRIHVSDDPQSQKSSDGSTPIELANWPNRDVFQKAINEWNAGLQKAEEAWNRLNEDEKTGLIDWRVFLKEISK